MDESNLVRDAFSLLKMDHINFISRNEESYNEQNYQSCTRIREIEKLQDKILCLLRTQKY